MKKELDDIKKNRAERVLKALSARPQSSVKKGVDLASLAQNLAKRHIEKLKSSSEE